MSVQIQTGTLRRAQNDFAHLSTMLGSAFFDQGLFIKYIEDAYTLEWSTYAQLT